MCLSLIRYHFQMMKNVHELYNNKIVIFVDVVVFVFIYISMYLYIVYINEEHCWKWNEILTYSFSFFCVRLWANSYTLYFYGIFYFFLYSPKRWNLFGFFFFIFVQIFFSFFFMEINKCILCYDDSFYFSFFCSLFPAHNLFS